MAVNTEKYQSVVAALTKAGVTLVAVSKTKPAADIMELYVLGQKDFGENYVQELADKQAALPGDIRWHFIGHLQSNKVKYIAPFVHLVHGVDSYKLLKEIDKQAAKCKRVINCLLQVHIAQEETKFGLDEVELKQVVHQLYELKQLENVRVLGLMGMASFSDDAGIVRSEFKELKLLFDKYKPAATTANDSWTTISMGMSSDYQTAIQEGSTMVRIGSLLFGAR